MTKNYTILTERVQARLNPEHLSIEKAFSTPFSLELSKIDYNDALVYTRLAMKGVGAQYTSRSLEAGENAKAHLKRELTDVRFEYQGSVMSNTHIKANSDIDLLTITDEFYSFDRTEVNLITESQTRLFNYYPSQRQKLEQQAKVSVWNGDVNQTLKDLRADSERILSAKYKVCDTSHAKAIKLTNMGIGRDVDVVIANYYDDVTSVLNDKDRFRGIQVYHKDTNSRGKVDYPFRSIALINERGTETNNRLRKMIRFLKNVKFDSGHDIKLSSFDINAICYDIDVLSYRTLSFAHLVAVLYTQIKSLCDNSWHSDRLTSVDGREKIFLTHPDKLTHLRTLLTEVTSIYADLITSGALK
jgi:hypothetical protein